MRSKLTAWAWKKVSEQFGVACFYHSLNASRTLPPSFIYSVWPSIFTAGMDNHSIDNSMCYKVANVTLQAVCLTSPLASHRPNATHTNATHTDATHTDTPHTDTTHAAMASRGRHRNALCSNGTAALRAHAGAYFCCDGRCAGCAAQGCASRSAAAFGGNISAALHECCLSPESVRARRASLGLNETCRDPQDRRCILLGPHAPPPVTSHTNPREHALKRTASADISVTRAVRAETEAAADEGMQWVGPSRKNGFDCFLADTKCAAIREVGNRLSAAISPQRGLAAHQDSSVSVHDPRCLMSREACDELGSKAAFQSNWAGVHERVHVVHFKGRFKPWELLNPADTRHSCHLASYGKQLLAIVPAHQQPFERRNSSLVDTAAPMHINHSAHHNASIVVDATDDLRWDRSRWACLSIKHGLEVRWGRHPIHSSWISSATSPLPTGDDGSSAAGGTAAPATGLLPLTAKCCNGHVLQVYPPTRPLSHTP